MKRQSYEYEAVMYTVENTSPRNEISLISMITRKPETSVRTATARNNALSFDVSEHFGIYTHTQFVSCSSNEYVTNNFEDCENLVRWRHAKCLTKR
jgi:hypothetical protein